LACNGYVETKNEGINEVVNMAEGSLECLILGAKLKEVLEDLALSLHFHGREKDELKRYESEYLQAKWSHILADISCLISEHKCFSSNPSTQRIFDTLVTDIMNAITRRRLSYARNSVEAIINLIDMHSGRIASETEKCGDLYSVGFWKKDIDYYNDIKYGRLDKRRKLEQKMKE
jgi:hypothetical protein